MFSLFKKSLTVDEAAEALYMLMQKDFNREWLSKLSKVSGLDLVRAEDELVFLDFFAIYFSLKFTHSPGVQGDVDQNYQNSPCGSQFEYCEERYIFSQVPIQRETLTQANATP
jgi:hypothetical protein